MGQIEPLRHRPAPIGCMASLPPPDHHHFNAALGWLELGNPTEAQLELDRLAPPHHEQPEVLTLQWQIHAARPDWESAVRTAQRLTQVAPDDAWGWVHLAFALHELKRTAEAWNILQPVATRFPHDFLIRYNLACYASQLNQLALAWDSLQDAMALGGRDTIKQMAREDADLEPLWPRLDAL